MVLQRLIKVLNVSISLHIAPGDFKGFQKLQKGKEKHIVSIKIVLYKNLVDRKDENGF